MPRARDIVLVCSYLVIAVLPVIAMLFDVHDVRINGVYVHPPAPSLAFSAVTGETFQKDATAWFEDRLGLKGYSVHLDNSILFHVFGETKPGANVRVGADGVLFQPDDLYFMAKYATGLQPSAEQIEAFAAKLAAIQTKLAHRGKALVPIIIPAKTTIYRDAVPSQWRRDVGDPPPTDTLVYAAFKAALDRHQVVYVDSRAAMTAPGARRELLWGRQARHWSYYAACLALHDVAADYGSLTGRPIGDYPCAVSTTSTAPRWHDDYDLLRLLNAFKVPRASEPVPVVGVPPLATTPDKPDALIIGSSFGWMLVRDAQRSGVFGKLHFNYYNNSMFDWPTEKRVTTPWEEPGATPIEPFSPEWRAATVDKDLYILDLFEAYLIIGSYSGDFLDQLDQALGP